MISQAFVLGAGLGTRLRPLTDSLPKPLVPIFQKPLITFAFDHLIEAGCEKFFVNTHHLPERYAEYFEGNKYRDRVIEFHHEPVLLETAGGIANIADSWAGAPLLVYNGDILTDLPLAPLVEEHFRAGNLVTLALRTNGEPKHIALNEKTGQIVDIRNQLGTGAREEFLFTGIYMVSPALLRWLKRGVKRSVIPVFLELIQQKEKLGGIVINDGEWRDVGTRASYLQLHRDLMAGDFPRYATDDRSWRSQIHHTAVLENGAQLLGCSTLGANTWVGSEAILKDTIVWPGARVASGSRLQNCVVRCREKAEGTLHDVDI